MLEYPACPYPSFAPPARVRLTVLPASECSYLPGRRATSRAFYAANFSGEIYHELMNAGFRRSGRLVYQPICAGCRECRPIRVRVTDFAASKSQRRCLRGNEDLIVEQGKPVATEEKFELYRQYIGEWHGTDLERKPMTRESFESFLYDSPVETIEFCYRDRAGQLLGVGICDVSLKSLSSVYFYFQPGEARRGLGTFGALHELAWAKERGIPFYYLGYWVRGCGSMEYKWNYRPCEVLLPTGVWCDEERGM